MRSVMVIAASLIQSTVALASKPIDCSTWQQITTCSSPDGYVSHESTWNGITTGDDNQGNKGTSWRWQGAKRQPRSRGGAEPRAR
jgi:hypothetical protein